MSIRFAELDRRETAIGVLTVRRRLEPILQVDVYEVILDDEHLMSNIFTAAEIALADLGLAALAGAGPFDVAVGGLGLGYTAQAALADERVASVQVVEALDPVIEWHHDRLFPVSDALVDDARCAFVSADFFARVARDEPFATDGPARHHAILLDIDHTPGHVLDPSHAPFYTATGLAHVVDRLHPGGVFALWSDRADDAFLAVARDVFATCEAHEVRFPNHHTGDESANWVYVATTV